MDLIILNWGAKKQKSTLIFTTDNNVGITTNAVGGVAVRQSESVFGQLKAVKVLLDDQRLVGGYTSTDISAGTRVSLVIVTEEETLGRYKSIYWFNPVQTTNTEPVTVETDPKI